MMILMDAVAWVLIIIAGFLEPCWVYTLGRSDNFKKIKWAAATVIITAVDIYLLSIAMQYIGAGLSYAIWTGIGAIVTLIMGAILYKEKITRIRIFLIFLIIAGIVGLNLASGGVING